MPNYCQTIWEAYNTVATTELQVNKVIEQYSQSGRGFEIARAKLADMAETLDDLQEVWDGSFEILPDGRKLFGPEYEAVYSFYEDQESLVFEEAIKSLVIKDGHTVEANLSYIGFDRLDLLPSFTRLTDIDLRGNNITKITPLGRMKNLQYINLMDNKLEDISPLLAFTSLKVLDLRKNPGLMNEESSRIIEIIKLRNPGIHVRMPTYL